MLVRQAANVLELMEYFAARKRPATLAEISEDMEWPKSSTFNLVGTLTDKGYLYETRARAGYYPSPRWMMIARAISEAEPLPDFVLELTAEIARATGETTAVGAAAGTSVIFLHVIESQQPIRYFAQVGTQVPIHASSAGRAILAQMQPAERRALYRRIPFERYSATSPMDVATIEAELRLAEERGYHQSNSEYIADLAGVALPLPVASRPLSIVVAGPVSRCLEARPRTAALMSSILRTFPASG